MGSTGFRAAVSAAAFIIGGSNALAGETVIYAPAPAWAQATDPLTIAKTGPSLAVYEDQGRIETGGQQTDYEERAWRLSDPTALTRLGTVSLVWNPDQGDLIVHRLLLIRDGKPIDVLKDSKFTVLRREQALEQRVINGALTATLAVPGAEVGDTLFLAYGRNILDRALSGHSQTGDMVPVGQGAPERGHLRLDWPATMAMQMRAMPERSLPAVVTADGRSKFAMALPIERPKEMPKDAPLRFRSDPVVLFTDFKNRQQLSTTFEPLFTKAATFDPAGPLTGELARIKALPTKPAQMLAALQLVQNKVSYLLNGMRGGNYIPQSANLTWSTRYGDCKAKTALLLALLRQLDIPAEAMLVNANVPDLPLASVTAPIAFDHVIVRAHLDGRDWYLDGTDVGASEQTLGNGPSFLWGLPLTSTGSDLVALTPAAPSSPSVVVNNRIDLRAGPDFAPIVTSEVTLFGQVAAMLQPLKQVPDGRARDDAIDGFFNAFVGNATIIERSAAVEADKVVMRARYVEGSRWEQDGKRYSYAPIFMSTPGSFKPDRSKAAWAKIPVSLGAPARARLSIKMELPDEGRGVATDGASLKFASRRVGVERTTTVSKGTVQVEVDVASPGGELAPGEIAAERARSLQLDAASMRVRLPIDTRRNWQMTDAGSRAAVAPLLNAYTALIASRPEETTGLVERGWVYSMLSQYPEAERDFTKAIVLEETADNYALRASVREWRGDLAGAITDRTKAYELDGTADRLSMLTFDLDRAGKAEKSLDLSEAALENPGDDVVSLTEIKARALGHLGQGQEGLALLETLAEDRPGDSGLLDFTCYHKALWNVGMSDDGSCEKAVTLSSNSASALQSRALFNLRAGRIAPARKDIDAALEIDPGNEDYLIVRSAIRLAQGELAASATDRQEAEQRSKLVGKVYQTVGLLP